MLIRMLHSTYIVMEHPDVIFGQVPKLDNNNNNNILYLYTLSREETLFKCVYSGTILQTKNIINDDNR